MPVENTFRLVRELIANKEFEALKTLDLTKPSKFNWVSEIFENIHVKENPEGEALIWTDGRRTIRLSFKEMSIACNRFLNLLRRHGIGKNDCLFAQISLLPENWLTMLVSIKGGFRLIPASTILSVQDIVYRFGILQPEVVLADTDNAVKIDEAELLSGKPIAVKIIVGAGRQGWISFDKTEEEEEYAGAAETEADDPLFLFFTSGTTGMPKIVTHTHISYPIGHLTTASWIGIRKGDIHYNIAQPGWAKFAWSSFFAPWSVGATIFSFFQTGRFVAAEQLEMIEKFKITSFCAPPTALRMLILEDLSNRSFSLRECVAAGEPLNPEVIETWKKGTGLILRDGYGQTETTCLIANLSGEPLKYGSMGRPTFLYDIIIADETGNELPLMEEGNITVRTGTPKINGLFAGYFADPAKGKEVFKHGLYYTGDKAYKDREGYIWFVGRDDDVIKTSDYRVGPFEVESILLEHEQVIESAVVGSPHPVKGYLVKAFIVLSPGTTPSNALADEIFSFAKKSLSAYKIPRIIEFVEELPKTISGKIRRVELRANEREKKNRNEKASEEYFY
jgi:acyl-coenzyme A synthetase/AMP-(fatty) acid ligase